jgi:hypothetical protein
MRPPSQKRAERILRTTRAIHKLAVARLHSKWRDDTTCGCILKWLDRWPSGKASQMLAMKKTFSSAPLISEATASNGSAVRAGAA